MRTKLGAEGSESNAVDRTPHERFAGLLGCRNKNAAQGGHSQGITRRRQVFALACYSDADRANEMLKRKVGKAVQLPKELDQAMHSEKREIVRKRLGLDKAGLIACFPPKRNTRT